MGAEITVNASASLFINGFINPNRTLLDELNLIRSEIEVERTSWIQSGATEQIVETVLEAYQTYHITMGPVNTKEMNDAVRRQRLLLYGDQKVTAGAAQFINQRVVRQLPPKARSELMMLGQVVEEHAREYNHAIRDLTDQEKGIGGNLLIVFSDYLSSDPQNFRAFSEFLSGQEWKDTRNQQRPFLQALQRQREASQKQTKPDLFDNTKRQVVEKVVIEPPTQLFIEFVKHLSTDPRKGGSVLQWVQLATHPNFDSQVPELLDRIRQSGIFPEDLSHAFSNFVDQDLSEALVAIRQQLFHYRPEQAGFLQTEFRAPLTKKRHGQYNFNPHLIIKEVNSTPEPERRTDYSLVLHKNLNAGIQEVQRFISKAAYDLDPNDPRMQADMQTAIAALIDDPFGLGIRVLKKTVTTEDNRTRPLRRFRASQRPGVSFQHPESQRVRVIFYTDPKNPDTVYLYEIIHRDDLSEEYGGRD